MNKHDAELLAISETANLYIAGVRTGNVDLLRQAFHPKAMMYWLNSDQVKIEEIESWYAVVATNESPVAKGRQHHCFITGIDYIGDAAFVQMIEESSQGYDYANYFLLLKIEGRWIMMSKSYNPVKRNNSFEIL